MRPASTALKNYLNALGPAQPATFVDLITFALAGGEVLRYSMGQYAMTGVPQSGFQAPDGHGNGASINYAASGSLNFPLGPVFGRAKPALKVGLDPQKLMLSIAPHPPTDAAPDLVGTLSWQAAVLAGLFDGGTVEIDRLFQSSPTDTSLGSYVLWLGVAGQVEQGRGEIKMEVPNLLFRLGGQYPRRLYDSGCTWVFGDANCTFNRASLAQNITAGAGSTATSIVASVSNQQDYASQGTITGTSGANNGITRTISGFGGGATLVKVPFPYAPAVGDSFQLLPGCDHTITSCQSLFNNFANFGGFPYIPPPEAAV